MHPRALLSLSALTLGIGVVGACGGGGGNVTPENVLAPAIHAGQVAVKSIGLEGGRLGITLVIVNPNPFTLPSTGISGTLYLGGVRFGNLELDNGFMVAQEDTTRVTAPVTFQWSSVGVAARGVLGYGSVDYKLHGTLYSLSPQGHHLQLPFTAEGSVPIVQALNGASH
jgi:hypothetical protein